MNDIGHVHTYVYDLRLLPFDPKCHGNDFQYLGCT